MQKPHLLAETPQFKTHKRELTLAPQIHLDITAYFHFMQK